MFAKSFVSILILAILVGVAAPVASSHAEDRVAIHFADLGGIKNWRPDSGDSLLVEGRNSQWYRATFWGPCHELKFHESIAFVTSSGGDLDKFGSILVGGERCWFRTFRKVDKPS